MTDDKAEEVVYGGPDWPTPSRVVAIEMARTRKRIGVTADALAQRVRDRGGKLDRAAISKIENGLRDVSLDEALLLAIALGVAPVHLFVPRDDSAAVAVTPDMNLGAVDARRWVRGEHPIVGEDDRAFHTEVPESEWAARNSRAIAAQNEVEALRRRYRVARELASTITSELAELDRADTRISLEALQFGTTPAQKQIRRLETRLGVAYDQIAETKVDLDEAEANLLFIQREIHGRWS